MKRGPVKAIRCAIYTRKSTEEGLDQAFNSLHAQREACEAYIKSQAGEGWEALGAIYDDGGFSGGNMERPALRSLLADIDRGVIDIVVVYKVDRLTRSLTDFARIVERFDAAEVSFVSVTQAFNTTTSMGRLTLNVLLSFAQFEREVTGERIRDKIAASKAKGMWMGGNLPLGYDAPVDPKTRALVVNDAEAATVRLIFERYLALRSVHGLAHWLRDNGIRSKLQTSAGGRVRGGAWFNRGALFYLLKNRVYLGEIPHRDRSYPGAHPPIISAETFDEAQILIRKNAQAHVDRPTKVGAAPLRGKLFDGAGRPMSPTFSQGKSGRPYRYYVTTDLQTGTSPNEGGHLQRLSAESFEDLLADCVGRLLDRRNCDRKELLAWVSRVDVRADVVEISLCPAQMGMGRSPPSLLSDIRPRLADGEDAWLWEGALQLHIPSKFKTRGGRTWLSAGDGTAVTGIGRADTALSRQLRVAHAALRDCGFGPETSLDAARDAVAPTCAHSRKVALLAFMAPDLQRALMEGRLRTARSWDGRLAQGWPLLWSEQRRLLAVGGDLARPLDGK